jgi:hypothetical protein
MTEEFLSLLIDLKKWVFSSKQKINYEAERRTTRGRTDISNNKICHPTFRSTQADQLTEGTEHETKQRRKQKMKKESQ